MKNKSLVSVTVIILLSVLLGSSIAFAQGSQPPDPRRTPRPVNLPPVVDLTNEESGSAPVAVTLGEPGFSLRYVDTFGIVSLQAKMYQ